MRLPVRLFLTLILLFATLMNFPANSQVAAPAAKSIALHCFPGPHMASQGSRGNLPAGAAGTLCHHRFGAPDGEREGKSAAAARPPRNRNIPAGAQDQTPDQRQANAAM